MRRQSLRRFWAVLSLMLTAGSGCRHERDTDSPPHGEASPQRVVVYCSVDEAFARGVLKGFTKRTGVQVDPVFDSEAGKTTGLVNRIVREAQSGRPRADVFWSSELFNTILLAGQGLLEPYDSPAARDIPDRFRDSAHRWTAVALRARVLAFDPSRVAREDVPTTWEALAQPRLAGQLAFANPLFGTTRGHVAAMFALWGSQRGRAFLSGLRKGGARIVDGNSAAVRAVIDGRVIFAATDTDDVWVARKSGASLDLVYPDLGDGGTLLIPCSVALIKGGPHAQPARRLVDFLLSADVERLLARSDSRNIPVRPALRIELGMAVPPESAVAFGAVADAMGEAVKVARETLIR